MSVHIAISSTVKYYSPWIWGWFFLWFQSFLLSHLTLCLITSLVCPSFSSTLMSRGHLNKVITPEKTQCFRKRQEEHLHSGLFKGVLRLVWQDHEGFARFYFVVKRPNQWACKDPSLDFYCKIKSHLFHSFSMEKTKTYIKWAIDEPGNLALACVHYTLSLCT